MSGIVLKNLMEIMQAMINLELALARFYEVMGEAWPEDAEFWLEIKADEVNHARTLKGLFEMIKERPDEFSYGRSFNLAAIKTVTSHIETATKKVSDRQMDKDRALVSARDLERSLMEANYPEIVQSKNVKFQELVRKIANQTSAHEKKIKDRAAQKRASR